MRPPADNVTPIAARRTRLEYRLRGLNVSLEYDNECLYESWSRWGRSGERVFYLDRLSPMIRMGEVADHEAGRRARTGALCLLAALTIYFSDYHARIPLAAPLLALIGLGPFAAGIYHLMPVRYVQIYDNYNNVEVSIPIAAGEPSALEQRRTQFVDGLREKIEAAILGENA